MGRLQTARLESMIRRWGSIKGGGSLLSDTLADVFPVFDLENLTPEMQLLADWFPWFGFATILGGVAQLGGLLVQNAADSGKIVVVEKMIINTVVAQDVTCGVRAVVAAGAAVRNRDGRSPNLVNNNVQIFGSNNTTTQFGMILQTAANIDREFEIRNGIAILGPGSAFAVVMSVANETMTGTFIGRVRQAEPSELNF